MDLLGRDWVTVVGMKMKNISLNTPNWKGSNDKVAHITYRTMDAKSLLQLYKLTKNEDLVGVIDKIRYLLQEGLLLPELNQILVDLNLEVKLPKAVGKYYSRPTSPWADIFSDMVPYIVIG